jgi:hypothetical protein
MEHDAPRLLTNARQPPSPATLTIDETTAHATAPPGLSEELFRRMRRAGIPCRLLRQAGVRGLDLIDFGNPSPPQERQIRAAFRAFVALAGRSAEGSAAWGGQQD